MTAPEDRAPAGVYVHVPFCAIRCTYCDFATVAGEDARIPAYLDALVAEIERFQLDLPETADTVFLGGGTPSRLTPAQVGRILQAVRRRFRLSPGAEVTLEGNPESLTEDRMAGWAAVGVTRVSSLNGVITSRT